MSGQTYAKESAIRWTNAFSVGVESLDQQHQELFAKVAELSGALSRGEGRTVVDSVLADLAAYAIYHFADEEALMAQYGFPSLSSHRAAHERFRKQIEAFLTEHHQGKVGVPAQLLMFMQCWLKEHVAHTDKQYTAFLNARGVR